MPPTVHALIPLVADNIIALERALTIINRLPETAFTDQSEPTFSASVGEHFRHIIEHYRLFLNNWRDGLVDYNRRPRNAQLETDPASARAGIQDLCRQLRKLPDNLDLNQSIAVRCYAACETSGQPMSSCLGRELVFLHSHSTHHFALIAIILKQHGIAAHEDFGFAPSTRTHRDAAWSPLESQSK